jgi:hypothetical protein
MRRNRSYARLPGALILAAVLLGALPRGACAAPLADPGPAHLDGYLHANGGCLMLQGHDGHSWALVGGTAGLLSGDHVRLDGRFVRNPGCGASGFEVTLVRALWADDDHRSAYFDQADGEPFLRFAERSGRLEGEPGAVQDDRDRQGASAAEDHDREGGRVPDRDRERAPGRASGDRRERESPFAERPDRAGRYVYKGPHHKVNFVGTLHETAGGCPSLHTAYRVFALDGDLRAYQAGDSVRVSGELYEQDPDAPCGAATVVVTGIRGH